VNLQTGEKYLEGNFDEYNGINNTSKYVLIYRKSFNEKQKTKYGRKPLKNTVVRDKR
jgi:hypothetical protein